MTSRNEQILTLVHELEAARMSGDTIEVHDLQTQIVKLLMQKN